MRILCKFVTSVFPANAPFADQTAQLHLKHAEEAIDGPGFQGVGNWRAHIAQHNLGMIQCVSINIRDSPKNPELWITNGSGFRLFFCAIGVA